MILEDNLEIERKKLLGSLLLFTKTFYKLLTGREFVVSEPIGRESHHITICRELTKLFKLETKRLVINIPPGMGKSTMCCFFIAWAMAHYPDCNFIYVSYGKELATDHTFTIKRIMTLPEYRGLFGVELRSDSSAKDNFYTTAGGCVSAFGSSGPITGRNAGLPNLDRFSGMVLIDDAHKPDEVHSDAIREGVIDNYNQTIKPRPRSPNVPIGYIGHRLHEADLPAYLMGGNDGYQWKQVVLKALDGAGNPLNPDIHSREMLEIERSNNEYVFWSQYQQEPQPAGGSLFKKDWFVILDNEPEFISTFITADTAETDKEYNDATVFQHWGLYKIRNMGIQLDLYAIHLINCVEIRIEPKDLEYEFTQFYLQALRHRVQPMLAAIEKKSTGVTLVSILKKQPGLQILEIERSAKSFSKASRFIQMQPYVASGRISLLSHGPAWTVKDNKLINIFIEHMAKITANNTHRFDDVADAASDAVKIALMDNIVSRVTISDDESQEIVKQIAYAHKTRDKLRQNIYGQGN